MRKLTFLLALTALAVSSSGCCVCGRVRNWFHKGSPCGTTTVAPAVLGAPLAMGTPLAQPVMAPQMAPLMAAPIMSAPAVCCEQAPTCVQPCDPCDPCGDVTTGYAMSGDCGCGGAAPVTVVPGAMVQPGTTIQPGTVVPGPQPE